MTDGSMNWQVAIQTIEELHSQGSSAAARKLASRCQKLFPLCPSFHEKECQQLSLSLDVPANNVDAFETFF
jgi:hypothetical protein